MEETPMTLAEQVRSEYARGVNTVFLSVDGKDALVLTSKLSPAWINNATDADIRRVVVY